jgi:hypothetical protein
MPPHLHANLIHDYQTLPNLVSCVLAMLPMAALGASACGDMDLTLHIYKDRPSIFQNSWEVSGANSRGLMQPEHMYLLLVQYKGTILALNLLLSCLE